MDSEHAKKGTRLVAQAARRAVEGEARERITPVRDKVEAGAATVQSYGGKKIEQLARKIRQIGGGLERSEETNLLARRLEETADYLRFRPPDRVVEDARVAIRQHPAVPIAVALVSGLLAYAIVSRLHRR